MTSDNVGKIHEALMYEGNQAWEHYRHVENQRNSFLAFYFTIALASAGLIATLAARSDPDAVLVAIIVACPIATAVATLGALTYGSIVRFLYILAFYRRILLETRSALLLGFSDELDAYAHDIDVVRHIPRFASGRFRGPQAAAEASCGVSAALFGIFPILVAASAIWIPYPVLGFPIIGVCAAYAVLLTVFGVRYELHRRREEIARRRDRGHL